MRSIRSPLDGFASPFGRRASGGAAFAVDFTGLSTDSLGPYGQVGNHAAISYTTDPVSATETVKWSASSNPADAATFGTGASPTDFAVADGFSVYLHVTDGGETVTRSFTARKAPATAGAALDLSFVENSAITSTDLAQNFTGNGNTLTYLLVDTPPAGLSATGQTLTGTPTTPTADANYTFQGTDEYGRVVSVEHAIEITEPVPAPALLPWSDGPVITGALTQGAELTFSLGQWENATSFEIELVSATPTATLLARQSATGDTTGSFTADVGATLTLRVWATGPGGTTLEESAPFGPIEAAVTAFVEAFAFVSDYALDPTPSGFPVAVNKVDGGGAGNTLLAAYTVEQGWGWNTGDAVTVAVTGNSDPRLRARWSSNTSATFRIDLAPGTYRIYAAMGTSSTTTPSFLIWDYTDDALNSTIYELAATSTGGGLVIDPTATIRTPEDWSAASALGGSPATITVIGNNIRLRRNGATPQMQFFAIEEVV